MNAYYLAILTALIWGVVPIMEKLGLKGTHPIAGLAVRSLGVCLGLICLLFFYSPWSEFAKMSVKTIVLLALSGIAASLVAQLIFYHALKIGDVSRVVPVAGTYPLIAFVLGILLLGEKLTLPKTAGVILIMIGVILLR